MTDWNATLDGANKVAQLFAAAARAHRLLTVHWELTYLCNTRCTHCYAVKPGDSGFVAPAPELSTDECFGVIDQLAEAGALQIIFSGGEILTRKDFFEIAGYARKKQFVLRLLTNGTLVTPERADAIRDLHPMSVEISMYGAAAPVHDGITLRPGSWHKVLRAFQLLRERNVRAIMKVPVMEENVRHMAALRALAGELGVALQWDTMIVPRDNGEMTPARHRARDELLLEFFRNELPADYAPRKLGSSDKHCFSGMHTVAIDPYGQVFSCIQYRHCAGDLRRQSLNAILRESPVLRHMRSITVGSFPICSSCELRSVCLRCPGATETETGDLTGPSQEACRQAYLRWRVLQERGAVPAGETPLPAAWADRVPADGADGEARRRLALATT